MKGHCVRSLHIFLVFKLVANALAAEDDDPLVHALKFDLWQRGEHFPCGLSGCSAEGDSTSALRSKWMTSRHRPIHTLRGGADGCSPSTGSCEPVAAPDLDALRVELGPEFSAAIDRNVADHEADCATSCRCSHSPRYSSGAPHTCGRTRPLQPPRHVLAAELAEQQL